MFVDNAELEYANSHPTQLSEFMEKSGNKEKIVPVLEEGIIHPISMSEAIVIVCNRKRESQEGGID